MKQKVRILGIRVRILITTAIIMAITCLCVGYGAYKQAEKAMISLGVEEAGMAARIAAKSIDGDELSKIKLGNENADTYKDLRNKMIDIKDQCQMKYLYGLYVEDEKVCYSIDTDEENTSEIGEEFEIPYSELKGVFDGESYLEDYIQTTDEYGSIVTGYEPVYDSNNKVVAAVGCDYNAITLLVDLGISEIR